MNAFNRPATQVRFEDVQVGQDLAPLRKGPLTTAHLMRWSATMENWHKIHYDQRYAAEREKLPGLLINGSFKQQFIMQMLKDWAGREGWAWKSRFQFRAMDLVGSTLEVWARVKTKTELASYGLVELDLGIRNLDQEGRESTPGSALVALPYAGGQRVPYPFIPPAQDPWAKQDP
jgi:acyl dehydratase